MPYTYKEIAQNYIIINYLFVIILKIIHRFRFLDSGRNKDQQNIIIQAVFLLNLLISLILSIIGSIGKKKKKKMFIQIKNIWYYNVYVHKLKLSIKYFNLNITVTSHAEKVSMFTRQISDTRLSLLW